MTQMTQMTVVIFKLQSLKMTIVICVICVICVIFTVLVVLCVCPPLVCPLYQEIMKADKSNFFHFTLNFFYFNGFNLDNISFCSG